MTSWKDTLTPEQVAFLSSLRHASMSIQNEIDDVYEQAESMQNFVDNATDYLENLSAEVIGTKEEIQKLFEKEEKKKEEDNPKARTRDTFLESKHADIKATRDDDFYYAWRCNEKVVSVEYTPMNWPAVTVLIANKEAFDFKEQVTTLKEIGYEIEEE